MRPFVTPLTSASCQQSGNVTFHDGTAVATGAGHLHLVRRAFAVQAGPIESVEDRLGRGLWVNRLDRFGDADRQNASCMQRLSHCGGISPQGARD